MMFNTFRDAFSCHAQAGPDAVCLIVDGQAMTWRDIGLWTGRLAARVPRRDVVQGPKRAALLIDEPIEFLGVFLGLIALGWAPIPVPDRLRGESLKALLDDCAPPLVIASPRHARYAQDLCGSASILITSDLPEAPERNPLIDSSWEDELSPDEEMTIFYSSGTTSVPKGALHTHRAHCDGSASAIRHWRIGADERALLSAPIYTARTLGPLLTTAFAGGTSIVNQTFDVGSLVSSVRRHSPHTIDLVPTQFLMLIDDDRFRATDFACCRFIICGGAVLDPQLRNRLFELFPSSFAHAYGSTETSLISRLPRRAPPGKRASVGPPREVDVRILGEDNEELSRGEHGEIVVNGAANLVRYVSDTASQDVFWRQPRTGKAFYRTGDIGWIDPDGYLWLAGRKKDMIITAGFKVYPVDIEAVLTAHPQVREAAVVGKPHAVLGETPIGFITLKDQQLPSAATRSRILKWANSRLNANQRLMEVRILEAIPNTSSGKAMKAKLRQWAGESERADSGATADVCG